MGKKKKEEPKVLHLDYNDVANYVYNNLIDLGYVPTEDEVLDVADIMYDFTLQFANLMGIPMVIEEIEEEWEEE